MARWLSFLLFMASACSSGALIPDEAVESVNSVESMAFNDILDHDTFDIPGLQTHQSMAFFGGRALFITPVGSSLTCDIYDLETQVKDTTIILSHEGYAVPHANVSCLGRFFCSAQSLFPVLFVSAWDGGRQVFVYDIYWEDAQYGSRLVQVIDPVRLNPGYAGRGQMDWVVDTDHDMLFSIAYGLADSPYIYEDNNTHICQFKLPAIGAETVIYLEDTDIIDHFVLPVMTVFQDKCYCDGHIYVVAGISGRENLYPPRLFDIDIKSRSLEEKRLSITGEPEGFCFYQGVWWLNMYSSPTIYNIGNLL